MDMIAITNTALNWASPFISWAAGLDIERTAIAALSTGLAATLLLWLATYLDMADYRQSAMNHEAACKRYRERISDYIRIMERDAATTAESASTRAAQATIIKHQQNEIFKQRMEIKQLYMDLDTARSAMQELRQMAESEHRITQAISTHYTISRRGDGGRFAGKITLDQIRKDVANEN